MQSLSGLLKGMTMEKELTLILRTLKQKTGISVDVYTTGYEYLFSAGEKTPFVFMGDYTDGLQDKRQNATVFRFRFKRENYIGVIGGSTEVERNYALFICNYLENSGIQDDNLPRTDFLRAIVFGECSSMQIVKFMRKFSVPAVPCYILSITVESGGDIDETIDFLDNYSINGLDTAISINENMCVFVKFITSENESEYQSPVDFAEIFARSLFEETGVKVKVGVGGTVRSLSEAVQSYNQAESALKLGMSFGLKSSVHSYKEFILYKMLEELPPLKLAAFYNTLSDGEAKSIFTDPEMISTAEEFLENNLNVSETARKLYMHRNTLTYRLDKIERATGLNIRNFSDAVTFRLSNLLYKILNK